MTQTSGEGKDLNKVGAKLPKNFIFGMILLTLSKNWGASTLPPLVPVGNRALFKYQNIKTEPSRQIKISKAR